ncbi:type II toxin-antitoxin system RelE/ParE family toxin [Segnochrobactrum spirostomi]|uniref:Plasmid maintenance system killer protein n=1 Tax=Segnochrobactrum spirostomi TaxID=2608987 RepID=A0A6A7Y415_9HYPH|nr:type II toxin-antitoxin system RelE/ParE family toxin [Segnochrobactrum spirostomi]MQT12861.1 plasmid maintenance system killer protein [Segnochrobactrum spirostomi]
MIVSYRDRRTASFAAGVLVKVFEAFGRQATKRLQILEAATSLTDLRTLRSNRLERLSGDRASQYSIRINDRWRICFEWPDGAPGPSEVEIVDHH